jgi:hypothetical protein
MQHILPSGAAAGVDVGYFVLPPVTPGADAPAFGAGDVAGAFRDRPEVREFLRWVLSPECGALWAANPGGQFLPANVGFDVARCRAPGPTRASTPCGCDSARRHGMV